MKVDLCEIRRIYLDKEFRGKGNGKKLFMAALDFAEKNCSGVMLKTDSTLTKAIDMYLKHGFTLQKIERGYLYFEKKSSNARVSLQRSYARVSLREHEVRFTRFALSSGLIKKLTPEFRFGSTRSVSLASLAQAD